jgi:hypothetical protein
MGDEMEPWQPLSEGALEKGTHVLIELALGDFVASGRIVGRSSTPEGMLYDVDCEDEGFVRYDVHESKVRRVDMANRDDLERWLDS